MTSKQVILLTVPGLSFFYFRLRNKQFAATKCSIRLRMTWWPVYQLCRNLCAHWGIFLPPVWPVCVFFFCPLKQYKFAQKHTNCLPNILLAFVKAVEFRQIWSHCLPPPPPPKKGGYFNLVCIRTLVSLEGTKRLKIITTPSMTQQTHLP